MRYREEYFLKCLSGNIWNRDSRDQPNANEAGKRENDEVIEGQMVNSN